MDKDEAHAPKRRRWLRWLLRFSLAGVLLVTLAVFWGWHQRVALINMMAGRLAGDMQVKVADAQWEDGMMHFSRISIAPSQAEGPRVSADELWWRPDLDALSASNLGQIKASGVVVELPASMLKSGPSSPANSVTNAAAAKISSVELDDARFVLNDELQHPLFGMSMNLKVEGASADGSFDSASLKATHLTWRGEVIAGQLHADAVTEEGIIKMRKAGVRSGRVDFVWVKQLAALAGVTLPPVSGGFEWEWEGRDVMMSPGRMPGIGKQKVRLKDLNVRPNDGPGLLSVESFEFELSGDASGGWGLAYATLMQPVVQWTPELESSLIPGTVTASSTSWKLRVDDLSVIEGRVSLKPTSRCPVSGSFDWSGVVQSLDLSPVGAASAKEQKLNVSKLVLEWGRGASANSGRPFALVKEIRLVVVPDRLEQKGLVDSLEIVEPKIELTPQNGPWFDRIEEEPVAAPPAPKPWQRLRFDALTVTNGEAGVVVDLAERMEAEIRYEISTQDGKQRLRVSDAKVRIPKRANLPVLGLEEVEAVVSLPQMWSTRHVDSLRLKGGNVEAGEALMSLFSGPSAVVEKKVDAAAARWTAGRIDVQKLGVTIMSIAPGLPPVRFDVTFGANETPLDLDGLAENVEPQHILLTRLRIPSPHEPLRTVAEMDVIEVTYSLDGLLHRRIDRVEIVSPLLYVGEDMFWYVENYRKIIKGEPPKQDTSFGPPPPPPPTALGWRVETLAVTDGRLLLAPKGVPLRGFSKPFPFSFTTNLESGHLDAVFDIPADDYTIKDLKLEFRGMKGHVLFNLPMKDRNNNLTETFTVEQLRWKELHVEKAHLSVTYDAAGIYGSFGGAAYGGYVNGAFDIYLDEVFTWDGWVSGVDVNLGPVTRALFPNYLLLDGTSEGKVVATGNMHELYQADAEFKNTSSGRFSIKALNDMIDELPPVLKGDIADQITRIGLETLRDFEYDSVDGKARFYGREGRGHLRFTGPHGARKIDVNVYDHRWKEEPRNQSTADVTEEP